MAICYPVFVSHVNIWSGSGVTCVCRLEGLMISAYGLLYDILHHPSKTYSNVAERLWSEPHISMMLI